MNAGADRSYDGAVTIPISDAAGTLHRVRSPAYAGLDGHTAESIARERMLRARPAPKLLERVRAALRIRHRSPKTERAYVGWIRRFIVFNLKRHPAEMGAPEVERFLSSLAVEGNVSASTQNQALAAILFLYRDVLGITLSWMEGIVRAKPSQRLPTVLTRVSGLLGQGSFGASAAVK